MGLDGGRGDERARGGRGERASGIPGGSGEIGAAERIARFVADEWVLRDGDV